MTRPIFDALGVIVSDMEAALAFYRLLGLEFADGSESEGHVEAVLVPGIRVMFDTEELVRTFDADFEPPQGRGRIGLAFLCASPADVDEVYARVVAAGHGSHLAPFDAVWGQRYATVVDPDGNHVDLFARLG